ncbi:VOC family protein [Haliscomenobacter hydrossis]|uniref:Glyoxalase/bleomycin resistance protein/dioxygenase n=1 Tax=Haliscomenobacter hydrossis (strain ATCC 27775 / DSM 1100 / LMG 10767 / O) TaxID=760192 RepID=F4KXK6_HALH1|nr:VOC family protein [Haliscomenobacter hydrossis]AEE50377.1 Glyoxalase/bleomycin resistance protein/dioxygenase [Haliscomenobacter hydrossis DSM 1100]
MKPIWIEIPTTDIQRAKTFYESVFDEKLQLLDMGEFKMAIFTSGGFALCQLKDVYRPSTEGPLIYLNGNPDLNTILEKVAPAGGEILIEKRQISEEQGYMAVFTDTEGNRLGLRSKN